MCRFALVSPATAPARAPARAPPPPPPPSQSVIIVLGVRAHLLQRNSFDWRSSCCCGYDAKVIACRSDLLSVCSLARCPLLLGTGLPSNVQHSTFNVQHYIQCWTFNVQRSTNARWITDFFLLGPQYSLLPSCLTATTHWVVSWVTARSSIIYIDDIFST